MNQLPEKPKNRIGRRRWHLWIKNPHCHWCDKKLKWNESTADHLQQKTKLGEEHLWNKYGKIVLSCEKCNQQRQLDAYNEMNQVQQWLRTGNIPKLKRAWSFYRPTKFYARLWILYFYLKNYIMTRPEYIKLIGLS